MTDILGFAPPAPAEPVEALQPFHDAGVDLLLSYVGEAATNISGGADRGSAYAGQVYAGAQLDLDTILGLKGGSLRFGVTNRHGRSLTADHLDNSTSVQEIYGFMGTRLADLTYLQKLAGGAVEIEIGKGHANTRYLISPVYCNFQSNAVCGNPTIAFKNSNITGFPASTLMANARIRLTSQLAIQAGAFEVNPHRVSPGDDNFSFSLKHATGVYVPYEITYGTTAATDRLPRHYTVGGWFDRGRYEDPLLDAQNRPKVLSGAPGIERRGRAAIYFRFDQMLTRPDPRNARGLTLFGSALANLDGRVNETRFLELGLVQTGTVAGRDRDTFGIVATDQRHSDLFLETLRTARASVGSSQKPYRHQYMFELAYGAQITDAIRISPNLQYIVHPDTSGRPFVPNNTNDAVVVGFKFSIDGPTLMAR